MAEKRKGAGDLVDRLQATSLHTEEGLKALRRTVKAASKEKKVPKKLRKRLKALLPTIEQARDDLRGQGRSRKVKQARKELRQQLTASATKGSKAFGQASGVQKAKGRVPTAKKAVGSARKRASH